MTTESFTTPRRKGDAAAIDQLVLDALAYTTPEQLQALFDFSKKLPHYSPFNCMLLHIQRPEATWVAPLEKWRLLGCTLKPTAHPLLILAPMHPVMFVFDVADVDETTLTPAVRRLMEDPFATDGHVPDLIWKRLLRQTEKLGVKLMFTDLPDTQAGGIKRVTAESHEMTVNEAHSRSVQFTTIAHELGHLFCGHLGSITASGWPDDRRGADHAGQELEAESVALLVCQRYGLSPASPRYLADYLKPGKTLPHFSLEAILVATGAIHEMSKGRLPSTIRNERRLKRSGVPL